MKGLEIFTPQTLKKFYRKTTPNGIPQFKNLDKKNILVIGNSHGEDLFYEFSKAFDKLYEFSILSKSNGYLNYL